LTFYRYSAMIYSVYLIVHISTSVRVIKLPALQEKVNGDGLSPREFAVLLEISRVITSRLPLKNMFEVVHAYLEQIMHYQIGGLYVKEKGRLNLKVGVGGDDQFHTSLGKRAGNNFLLKKIKATGRPWRSTQILDQERVKKHPFYLQVLAPLGILYTAGAPIKDGHYVLGSIHLGRTEKEGDFTKKDMQVLEMVANLLAPAIKNIRIRQTSWQLDGVIVPGNRKNGDHQSPGDNGKETQRMELLGSVSSVMARELRNPLSNLKMSFYSLARNYTSGVMAQQDLEQMDRSIKNMDKTISFLYNLSKDLNLKKEWLDINELLDEVVETLGPIMDPDVVVVKDYAALPKLNLDREKMHAVFGNILENALDAMPGGGRLRIITTENQGRVYIIVEDNGLGVDREIREKIFEPFVTAKPSGVGLGLTVCKKIVESHSGRIKLRSNIGKGTAVCIDIPVTEEII